MSELVLALRQTLPLWRRAFVLMGLRHVRSSLDAVQQPGTTSARRVTGVMAGRELLRARPQCRLALIKHMKPLGLSVQAMLELLQARDLLHDPHTNSVAKRGALDTLDRFATDASERVDELHSQLDRAEDFAAQLSRELRRHTR